MPRHPPCALTNLTTKMLASTVQFSRNGRPQPSTRRLPQQARAVQRSAGPIAESNNRSRLFPQDPTACLNPHPHPRTFPTDTHTPRREPAGCTRPEAWTPSPLASVPPVSTTPGANVLSMALDTPTDDPKTGPGCRVLLRKEVIQPHLPVRLPCYDFVPIADPTFDSSLPTRGLSHWLRVLPTFVT